jgi:hypothetical protein
VRTYDNNSIACSFGLCGFLSSSADGPNFVNISGREKPGHTTYHTMNEPSIPPVDIKNSFLRPILSTKKHIETAVMKFTICKTPLIVNCIVESFIPISVRMSVMKYETSPAENVRQDPT